jgi:hypothetical protein
LLPETEVVGATGVAGTYALKIVTGLE